MKLKQLMENYAASNQQILVGREMNLEDENAFLLGLREIAPIGLEPAAKLTLLLEDFSEYFEEEEEWEEQESGWFEDNMTNRQMLIDTLDMDDETFAANVDAFYVNTRRYETLEMKIHFLGETPYEGCLLLQELLAQKKIPEKWLQKEVEDLIIAEYAVDAAILQVDWNADILNLSAEVAPMTKDVLAGKTINCPCGQYDVPRTFFLKNPCGLDIEVRIHGVYLYDIWADAQIYGIPPEDLELLCDRDERLLAVEYDTDDDLELEFYTREFLDAPADEYYGELAFLNLISPTTGRRLRIVDIVPKTFNSNVEIELLSYMI